MNNTTEKSKSRNLEMNVEHKNTLKATDSVVRKK
jgi:hypothetical protein